MREYEKRLFEENVLDRLEELKIKRPHSIVQAYLARYLIDRYRGKIEEISAEKELSTYTIYGRYIENWRADLFLRLSNGEYHLYEVKTNPRLRNKEFIEEKVFKMFISILLKENNLSESTEIFIVLPNTYYTRDFVNKIRNGKIEIILRDKIKFILYDPILNHQNHYDEIFYESHKGELFKIY